MMKFECPMLVVSNIEKSKKFYCDIFGLKVVLDFGANITFDAGFALQDRSVWAKFINKNENEITFGTNNAELYFEEDNFDKFTETLNKYSDIKYVHPIIEHDWGQRVVRIYDPDKHIIEVGESMKVVCKRFLSSGMSVKETALKTQYPVAFVEACLKEE